MMEQIQEKALMEGLFAFWDEGVSPFHSAAAACALLEQAGYRLCPESQPWVLEAGGRYYTTRNGTAVLAWRMPKGRLTGWHVTASHGDSPTWRLKVPDVTEGGYLKAETEGYGGMIASTWLDRPLGVAGRLLVRTGDGVESRLVAPRQALLCIPICASTLTGRPTPARPGTSRWTCSPLRAGRGRPPDGSAGPGSRGGDPGYPGP